VLFALSGPQGRQDTASAHSYGAVIGALRVVAHPHPPAAGRVYAAYGAISYNYINVINIGQ